MRLRLPRSEACAALAFSTLAVLSPPPSLAAAPSAADRFEVALALAPLFQLRDAVSAVDQSLFEGLMGSPERYRLGGGVSAKEGDGARSTIRRILKSKIREQSRQATAIAQQLQLLGRGAAADADGHAREAEERLASILEYDLSNSFKRDALNNAVPTMRREELYFYHRALMVARDEIEAVTACFGNDERREAARLSSRASSAPALLSAEGAALRAERDADVIRSINALPSQTGTVLTRGDLQRKLNNQWQDAVSSGQADAPRMPREARGGDDDQV